MLEERADEAVAAKRASWKKRVNIVRLFWWLLSSLVLFDACGELANCELRNKDGVRVKCNRALRRKCCSDADSDGKIENVPGYWLRLRALAFRLFHNECGMGWLAILIGQAIVQMTRTNYYLSIQHTIYICTDLITT